MKIFVTILCFCIFSCLDAFCQADLYKNNPNYKGELNVLCRPVEIPIRGVNYPLMISDSLFQANIFRYYSIYKLRINKTNDYLIRTLCDSSLVRFIIISERGALLPKYTSKRNYSTFLKAKFEKDKIYYIVLFKEDNSKAKTKFVFCEKDTKNISSIKGLELSESTEQKLTLNGKSVKLFEGNKSNIFDVSRLIEDNNYLKIDVKGDFVPVIYGLNSRDEIVKNDDGLIDENSTRLVVNKKDSVKKNMYTGI